MADLVAMLRTNVATLKMRANQGELLVIEDLISNELELPDDTEVFCIDGRIPLANNRIIPDNISPGLSFLWTKVGIEKFASSDRLRKSISEFQQFRTCGQFIVGSSTYLYAPNNDQTSRIAKALSRGVLTIVECSLNAINKTQERLDKLSAELISAVGRVGGRFGLSDLANFLKTETTYEFGLLHLAQSNSSAAPPHRTITVSTETSTIPSLLLLSDFLMLSRETFVTDKDSGIRPFPAVPLPQNTGSELIVNAGMWGRPLVSVLPGQSGTRFLIIPIARPFGPLAEREEYMPLAAQDLLFTFMPSLDRSRLDQILTCVETFSQHRFGSRRFNLLAQIQGGETSRLEINPMAHPSDENNDAAAIDHLLDPILNEVLYTTSAHSVTVRQYDPQTQALFIAASASGPAGEADLITPNQPIPIKNRVSSSVVVFTFMNAGKRLPYIYLRRMSPPVKQKINGRLKLLHRTKIPREYRAMGLQSYLVTRSLTRSEICFPLMKGRLAFGTLNLEAPYPSAFDQDIDYLNLVKSGIEKLFDSIDQKIDGRWLITSAARTDAVHQLWQYQESGTFFSSRQNKVLRMIFPPRSEHGLVGRRSLASLKSQTIEWVRGRWDGELRSSVIKMIKFDHVQDISVDTYFLEAAFVILRNLIQNAVKHGEPKQDLLFVDDRPWFGSRKTPCLRIYYRSSRPAPHHILGRLGNSPIEQPIGSRVAYGMYNAGLVTRLLGGSLHVSSQDSSSRLTIEAHLPLPEKE